MENLVSWIALGFTGITVLLTLLNFRPGKRNTTADTYSKLSSTVNDLSDQLDKVLERLDKATGRIATLEDERAKQDAENRRLLNENAELRRGMNKMSQKMTKVEKYIFNRWGVKIETDELDTPPPHNVPRSTWAGDPPAIDEPPNE